MKSSFCCALDSQRVNVHLLSRDRAEGWYWSLLWSGMLGGKGDVICVGAARITLRDGALQSMPYEEVLLYYHEHKLLAKIHLSRSH
jgi:hypothetical protein